MAFQYQRRIWNIFRLMHDWTEEPGMLQSMGSQRVGRNWVTEQNWTDLIFNICQSIQVFFLKYGQINNVMKSWYLSQRILCSFNYYWILLTYLTRITFSRPISFNYHEKKINHLELVFLFSLEKSRNRIARSCYSSIFSFF